MTGITHGVVGLDALRRSTLCDGGIVEEFLDEPLGSEGAFALLSAPLATPMAGWILCPSIGQEQGNLRRLEAGIARAVARRGNVTLRIRPDVGHDGALPAMDLDARIAEVVAAADVLHHRGVPPSGLIGAVSGAMVALLVADRLGVESLVLVEPVRNGRQYIRESLRRQAITDLIGQGDEAASSPMEQLETEGTTWIRGVRLTRAAYERIATVNALEAVRTFRGRVLLLGIAAGGTASSTPTPLERYFDELGADVTAEVVADELPVPLGEYHYENAGPVRHDTRIDLDRRLAERIAGWVAESAAT